MARLNSGQHLPLLHLAVRSPEPCAEIGGEDGGHGPADAAWRGVISTWLSPARRHRRANHAPAPSRATQARRSVAAGGRSVNPHTQATNGMPPSPPWPDWASAECLPAVVAMLKMPPASGLAAGTRLRWCVRLARRDSRLQTAGRTVSLGRALSDVDHGLGDSRCALRSLARGGAIGSSSRRCARRPSGAAGLRSPAPYRIVG